MMYGSTFLNWLEAIQAGAEDEPWKLN
jgi:hypothetical protein